MIKIQPNRTAGLCRTCREAVIVEYDDATVVTVCNVLYNRPVTIVRPVVKCSDYDMRGKQNNRDMEKIAWTIRTNRSGQPVGFAPPKPEKDE